MGAPTCEIQLGAVGCGCPPRTGAAAASIAECPRQTGQFDLNTSKSLRDSAPVCTYTYTCIYIYMYIYITISLFQSQHALSANLAI